MLPIVLIAENDPAAHCVLEMTLRQRVPCTIVTARYGYELLEQLDKHSDVRLVIGDLRLPDMSMQEWMSEVQYRKPALPVIVAAAARDNELAQQALELGAVDFLQKTDAPARIAAMIKSVLAGTSAGTVFEPTKTATPAAKPANKTAASQDAFGGLIGTSPAIRAVTENAKQAAASDIPVILKGESGVGKERFAQAIHASSARGAKPFVAVNCGAIPANLVESTLFGHVKGAFTGALADAPGKFREADGGTLFLDEVGELPADVQVKLLRVLQEKEVQPVGGGKPVKVDIRLLSATHVDLEQAIAQGRFREDLFYRLHVFAIDIPPLRARGHDDMQALITHFIARFSEKENKPVKGINDAALSLLSGYHWPGNIRQLENAIYRAVVTTQHPTLRVEDFVQVNNALQQRQWQDEKSQAAGGASALPLKADKKHLLPLLLPSGEFKTMTQIEAEILQRALPYYRWHITHIARALGLTRATIYKKMKLAGLQDPRDMERESDA